MSRPAGPPDFAERLLAAMAAEGKSQSRTERESGLPQGYMTRLLGKSEKAKQIFSPGPDVIRKLADYLQVSYEWLAIGRGEMRSASWAPSELEAATRFARDHGAREDAIQNVAARFRESEEDFSAIDWILEFDSEARRLERARVPRPEAVARVHRQMGRLSKKKQRLLRELAALEERERVETETSAKVVALSRAPKRPRSR
jgi:transcriptional regulator with XRE-family HTH domain